MPVVINKLNHSIMDEYTDEENNFYIYILILSLSINIYYFQKYNKIFSNFYKKVIHKYF